MRFKKSIVILIIFFFFTSIFNINSIAINTIDNKIIIGSSEIETDFDQYIIQLNNEPLFGFINRLKLTTKNIFLNLNEKLKNSFFSKNTHDYKEKLASSHKTVRDEILSILDIDRNPNNFFLKEYFNLFNGISIKKISEELIQKIRKLPNVKEIFPNYKIYATLDKSIPLINADDVWEIRDDFGKTLTGFGTTIAILDTGVDYNHIDLKTSYISEGSYDFVNNDTDPMDDNGHGTHVTGIAVGKGIESNYQYVGVAPDANFYSFKILDHNGEGNFSSYYNAMMSALDPNNDGDYSDKVDIVSLSFGTKTPGNPDDNLCQILDNVVESGVTVVVAAGNLGPERNSITSPGCARNSICVGSTNKNDIVATSSSRGPVEWEGNSIEKPDVVAPGVSIKSTKNNGGYEFNSGTSMATPHVAGAAALIKQANPLFNPNDIKTILKQSSKDIGYDINIQGHGRIDVLNAINPIDKFTIKAPDIVNETQIFKIEIFDNDNNPTRMWTLVLMPFHIPRLKYGHSRRFVAPLIVYKNKEFYSGKIIAFKFRGEFQLVIKDIQIVNKIRVNN